LPRHIDFMTFQIRGRGGESFKVDDQFVADAVSLWIRVGSRSIGIKVPSYLDYYILKLLSGRPGDIRDLAALTWKNGVPERRAMIKRIKAAVSTPHRIIENLEVALADIADQSFLDSWRGTFINQT
jgi:hypothetical protein